jgi:GxxExxY protein
MPTHSPQRHKRAQREEPADPWSSRIIGASITVHRALGPGLLESAYQAALSAEFEAQAIPFEREFCLPILYRGRSLDAHYRLDFLVGGLVVVEVKAVERVLPIHEAQLLTYLRLGGYRVGLLLNFCAPVLRQGIVRRVL